MTDIKVDTAAVAGQAREICDLADDLWVAAGTWQRAVADPRAALGPIGAADTLGDLREAWQSEFRAYTDVLNEWCVAAKAAAEGYQTVDEYSAAKTERNRIPYPR